MVKNTDGSSQSAKKVTIRDIAKELGLSHQAVSQALNPGNGSIRLSPKTAERIRLFASKKNYRPDSRARSMRHGRFYNIGYFEPRPDTLLRVGVLDVASEHDYRVVLIHLPSERKDDRTYIPAAFRESNLDALIVSHAGYLSPEINEAIATGGFPVVYYNEKREQNAIYADDEGSAEKLTSHLISVGRQHIVYVDTDEDKLHYSSTDRLQGYRRAMENAGLKVTVLKAPGSQPHWAQTLAHWFAAHPEVEAAVTYDDCSAIQLWGALLSTPQGIARDLPIATFGEDFGWAFAPNKGPLMRLPFYEKGRAATEMALALVNSGQKSALSQVFSAELVVRDA